MSINRGLKIAIDGPAGSGKSTVAREVARRLKLTYLDTGAMYRAITLKLLRENVDLTDTGQVEKVLERTVILTGPDERIYLDGEDVTAEIRTPQVNAAVSRVAELTAIRRKLVQQQKEIAAYAEGIVMEGRDISSRVMPDATHKFYLDAALTERARRRMREQHSKGLFLSFESVYNEIKERDRIDSERADSPLEIAPGVQVIDTTDLPVEEVVERVLQAVNRHRT
ncbi:MAG TPA: (d)CMP kinase [Bacillota bacterium]|jgi:cytidylate kinase|nr:(d)CMP kinase [Bacillota bacterium]HOA35780.1 (d)CMP kinase [Bacillota bacterium]HPZ11063.1 (d)CMP kinase [Bacillota bacterium]HQE09727.1 (d)CMP kinase [Bacillota bacterium]